MDPKLKTGLTHAGTAAAAAYATFAFLADNKADLYALWDQLNVIFAQITKFVATATPIATAAYGIYRTTTRARMVEVMQDPKAVEVAKTMPVTPITAAVANALKAAIVAAVGLSLFVMLLGDASAQPKQPPQVTGNLFKDIKANNAAGFSPVQGIQATVDQIKSVGLVDLKYAKALADAIGSNRSKIRSTCYAAWIKVIEQSQGLTAGPNGGPLGDMPDKALFTKFEQAVEVVDNLQPDSEFMVACQPAANLLKQSIIQFIASTVAGSAGIATLGLP